MTARQVSLVGMYTGQRGTMRELLASIHAEAIACETHARQLREMAAAIAGHPELLTLREKLDLLDPDNMDYLGDAA